MVPQLAPQLPHNSNMKYFTQTKGAIGILTTIVFGSVLVILAVGVVLSGISSRQNAFVFTQTELVFVATEGCSEEALIQLSRNNAYTGGNYELDGVDCTVSVSGSDPNRDVVIVGTKNDITRAMVVRVQLTPTFGIIDWDD